MTEHDHEWKFSVTRDQAEAFLARIAGQLELEVRDAAMPVAYTRTTYLDADDLPFHRSHDGPVRRRLRVREYASARGAADPARLTGVAFLEYKETEARQRVKLRVPVDPQEAANLLRGGRPSASVAARLGALSATIATQLVDGTFSPRVTTWYRRISFCGESVRVTIDEDVRFALPPAPGVAGDPAEPPWSIGVLPYRLLELKPMRDLPDWLAQAVDGLTEAAHLSKYHLGMQALTAPAQTRATQPLMIPSELRRGRS